jgi:SAM-dependent methyltransferase
MPEIKPMTMPGTHDKFLKFFRRRVSPDMKVLDLGAGHGAFTKTLHEMGYEVHACDLFPEIFEFEPVECRRVDITSSFPYEDNAFDAIIAIEVSEHITDHQNFFRETNRILRPDGKLYLSTPNILSIKSRIRFLKTGFFYTFIPLEMKNYDGLQHVSSLTLDQYNYIAIQNNYREAEVEIDKYQRTSVGFFILLYPLLYMFGNKNKLNHLHNRRNLLFGRLLFLTFAKNNL